MLVSELNSYLDKLKDSAADLAKLKILYINGSGLEFHVNSGSGRFRSLYTCHHHQVIIIFYLWVRLGRVEKMDHVQLCDAHAYEFLCSVLTWSRSTFVGVPLAQVLSASKRVANLVTVCADTCCAVKELILAAFRQWNCVISTNEHHQQQQ